MHSVSITVDVSMPAPLYLMSVIHILLNIHCLLDMFQCDSLHINLTFIHIGCHSMGPMYMVNESPRRMQHENELFLIHTRSHMKDTSTYIGCTRTLERLSLQKAVPWLSVLTRYYVDASLLSHEEELASSLPPWLNKRDGAPAITPGPCNAELYAVWARDAERPTCRHRGKGRSVINNFQSGHRLEFTGRVRRGSGHWRLVARQGC